MKNTGTSSINTAYLLLMSLTAALGGFLFGYDWVVIGGAKPFYEAYFNIGHLPSLQGWVMGSAILGCLIGVTIAGSLADKHGRKPLMMIAAMIFIAASIGTGFSHNISTSYCLQEFSEVLQSELHQPFHPCIFQKFPGCHQRKIRFYKPINYGFRHPVCTDSQLVNCKTYYFYRKFSYVLERTNRMEVDVLGVRGSRIIILYNGVFHTRKSQVDDD